MIKANELRIGNKVYGGLDEVLTVTGIRETGVDTNEGSSNIVGINPIQLSPELLEKCGFVKDINVDFVIDLHPNSLKIIAGVDDYYYPIYYQHPELSGEHDNMVGLNRIKHLHQLQNLYFCLCGEELEVKM